jgi:hypothetical protein
MAECRYCGATEDLEVRDTANAGEVVACRDTDACDRREAKQAAEVNRQVAAGELPPGAAR